MDLKCVFTNKSLIIGTNQQTSAREEWRHATAGVLVLTGSIVCAGAGLRAGPGVVTTVSIAMHCAWSQGTNSEVSENNFFQSQYKK